MEKMICIIPLILLFSIIIGLIYLADIWSDCGTLVGIIKYKFGWYRYEPTKILRDHCVNNPDYVVDTQYVNIDDQSDYPTWVWVKTINADACGRGISYKYHKKVFFKGVCYVNHIKIPKKHQKEMVDLFLVLSWIIRNKVKRKNRFHEKQVDKDNTTLIESYFNCD